MRNSVEVPFLIGSLLLAAGLLVNSRSAATPNSVRLETAAQVHRLSYAAAGSHLPVVLHGTVTQFIPEWNGFSLQDATDAVYVYGAGISLHLQAGDRVELHGNSETGNYAPLVRLTQISILGHGALPDPRPVDWRYLSSGACDNEYVSITGVVRAVVPVSPPRWRWDATAIHVDVGGNVLWAYARSTANFGTSQLTDQMVRIDGTCIVLANSRKRFEGTSLLISDSARGIHVLDPVPSAPENLPLTPLDHVFAFNPGGAWQRRIRVRGTVTSSDGDRITIQHDMDGVVIRTVSPASLQPGQVVDAVGFPTAGSYGAEIEDAVLVPQPTHATVTPLQVRAAELVARFHQGRPLLPDSVLVRVQATVLGVSESSGGEVIALQDGPTVFNARLHADRQIARRPSWPEGSKVALTGICSVQVDDLGLPQSFELVLRSPADVQILSHPDWFTRRLALQTAALLLAVVLIAVLVLILLTRHVGAQSGVIQQQRKREEELNARMRELVDNANDLVYILDTDARILHLNFGAERLTGYSRSEQLHRKLTDLLVPEERDRFLQSVTCDSRAAASRRSRFEQSDWTFLCKNGQRLTLELNQRFVTDDNQVRIEVIGRDVTARKQAILDNEERFRTLADNIPQLAWIADASGAVVWLNRRWFEYAGTNLEQSLGWGWQQWCHPEHLERVSTGLRDCFTKGEEWEDSLPLRGRNGQFRWFLGRATPIRDSSGNVVRWFGTKTDITEQKQTETELKRSNEDLRQFAYIASHDLQEPIRNMSLYSQLLARSLTNGDLTPERSKYIDVVVNGARRIQALLSSLLAYSQVTGTGDVQHAWISSAATVQDAIENLRSTIEETGANVTYTDLPELVANSIQLTQVFQNLIGNALKYRRDGVPPEVKISAVKQVDSWLFSVQDNGQGFNQQYAEKLFGIFKRLHGTDVPGTGIGLAICRAIIERHSGKIWAVGKPGEGATFCFTLPASRKQD
jgi:PAS domain S-box-containing protein